MRRALVEMIEGKGVRRIALVTEEPIYEWRGVLVSTSRFSHNGHSYPIDNVGSIQVRELRSRSMLAAIVGGMAVVLATCALVLFSVQFAVLAIAVFVWALTFPSTAARTVSVEIGAERLTICASDPAMAAEIADAISVAKRSVHSVKREPAFAGDRALARAARASGAA